MARAAVLRRRTDSMASAMSFSREALLEASWPPKRATSGSRGTTRPHMAPPPMGVACSRTASARRSCRLASGSWMTEVSSW